MSPPVFRFAPSPNGRLHLGHAYSALLNARLAREAGGRLLLRIEDIDPARSRPELVGAIVDDLGWLGLRWEEPVRRQSRHLDEYARAASALRGAGLLYPCFCTRGEIARAAAREADASGQALPRDPDGAPIYPGTCRELAPAVAEARQAGGAVPAWRLHTARAVESLPGRLGWTAFRPGGSTETRDARPQAWGDPVVVRRDVPTSYHVAVVVDDGLQGVTHVVRGRDLEAATDIHVLLQALLGLPASLYHHHDLVLDTDGAKLAKSRGSTSLADLRGSGVTPAEIRHRLGEPG